VEAITGEHRMRKLAELSQYQRPVSSRLSAGGAGPAGRPPPLAAFISDSDVLTRWIVAFLESLANLIIVTGDY